MKELISWFKILHSEGETRKGEFCISYSKSAWECQYGHPDSLEVMPQAKWLFWKCFHFLPFKHCSCLSQAQPPPVPSCSFVHAYQNHWGLQMLLAQELPRREWENQPGWLDQLPSTLPGHLWSMNGITLLWLPLWLRWPYGWVVSTGRVSYKIKKNMNMPKMAGFPLWYNSVDHNGRATFSSSWRLVMV